MKTQTTRKGNLYIEFQHVRPIVGKKKLTSTHKTGEFVNYGDAGTYCIIKENDKNGLIICQAQTVLHPSDMNRFSKEEGRRRSLKKALDKLFPRGSEKNKEDRAIVWNSYFCRGAVETKTLHNDPNAPWNAIKSPILP